MFSFFFSFLFILQNIFLGQEIFALCLLQKKNTLKAQIYQQKTEKYSTRNFFSFYNFYIVFFLLFILFKQDEQLLGFLFFSFFIIKSNLQQH